MILRSGVSGAGVARAAGSDTYAAPLSLLGHRGDGLVPVYNRDSDPFCVMFRSHNAFAERSIAPQRSATIQPLLPRQARRLGLVIALVTKLLFPW